MFGYLSAIFIRMGGEHLNQAALDYTKKYWVRWKCCVIWVWLETIVDVLKTASLVFIFIRFVFLFFLSFFLCAYAWLCAFVCVYVCVVFVYFCLIFFLQRLVVTVDLISFSLHRFLRKMCLLVIRAHPTKHIERAVARNRMVFVWAIQCRKQREAFIICKRPIRRPMLRVDKD